jgi:ATP-dependent 26S proteasome regulatory subunit
MRCWKAHELLSMLYLIYLVYRYLPREVDPLVYNMSHEDPGDVAYSAIGGLGEQIRELREVRDPSDCLSIYFMERS